VPPRQWRLFTREQLFGDRLRLDAVIKNLTVIGEAAGRVPADITEASPCMFSPDQRSRVRVSLWQPDRTVQSEPPLGVRARI